MTVRAKFELTNPDAAEATLTLTATIGEFKGLRNELVKSQYPIPRFRHAIEQVIGKAEAWFDSKGDE